MKNLVVLLTFALVLLVPSVALAEEIDYLDSFAGGFDTFVNGRESDMVSPEQEFNDGYVPVLREVEEVEVEEEGVLGSIQSWVSNLKIPWGANQFGPSNWFWYISGVLTGIYGLNIITIAIGLVFMWWGVRKAKHMIMTAFRSGRLTFGYDLNPRSYYFGTRRSDWR